MLEYEEINHPISPQNLLIFLHGYNGNLQDHGHALGWLKKYFPKDMIIAPHAPEICDKNPQKRQWFGMLKYDRENRRTMANTEVSEIIDIYDLTAEEIKARADEINSFISSQQLLYNLKDSQTFLIGFSQGAMLTLFSALTRPTQLGGAFSLSGLIAGAEKLHSSLKAKPPVYLFHGEKDCIVQFKTAAFSHNWLKNRGIRADLRIYKELSHHIIEDEIRDIAEIIYDNEKHML